MSKTRRAIGWCFIGASLLTHFITVWTYSNQPDYAAAFTVFPFWFWGGIGLLLSVFAFCFLRAPLSLIVTAVWAITLSVGMDEAKALSNFTHPKIAEERLPPEDRVRDHPRPHGKLQLVQLRRSARRHRGLGSGYRPAAGSPSPSRETDFRCPLRRKRRLPCLP